MPAHERRKEGPAPDPLVALNFLVHRDFRRRSKRCALEADITQKELLHRALEAWEEKQGQSQGDGSRPLPSG